VAVIKQHQASQMLGDAIVLDLGDIGQQASRIKEQAERRARQIEADARARADELTMGAEERGFEKGVAEGKQRGYEQGLKQGRDEAFAQMQPQLEQVQKTWSDVAGRFEQIRESLHNDARQALLELSLRLAEKVIQRSIDVDPTVVVDQVSAALAHVLGAYDVSVRIHPQDRPIMELATPDLLTEFSQLKHIALVDDDNIRPGGCIVNYGQGQIDATLDTQLRRIVELMVPAPDEASGTVDFDPDQPQDEQEGESAT
jgi:flagellar assembly protein FliH